MTVAQLALDVSLGTANYTYLFLLAVFLTADNSARVNYCYGRLNFGMFSRTNRSAFLTWPLLSILQMISRGKNPANKHVFHFSGCVILLLTICIQADFLFVHPLLDNFTAHCLISTTC